jgi:hypothetical protein
MRHDIPSLRVICIFFGEMTDDNHLRRELKLVMHCWRHELSKWEFPRIHFPQRINLVSTRQETSLQMHCTNSRLIYEIRVLESERQEVVLAPEGEEREDYRAG